MGACEARRRGMRVSGHAWPHRAGPSLQPTRPPLHPPVPPQYKDAKLLLLYLCTPEAEPTDDEPEPKRPCAGGLPREVSYRIAALFRKLGTTTSFERPEMVTADEDGEDVYARMAPKCESITDWVRRCRCPAVFSCLPLWPIPTLLTMLG